MNPMASIESLQVFPPPNDFYSIFWDIAQIQKLEHRLKDNKE